MLTASARPIAPCRILLGALALNKNHHGLFPFAADVFYLTEGWGLFL